MKRYKQITMTLTVRVPLRMSASEARREVKTLVSEQCNYSADEDEVRAVKCSPERDNELLKRIAESTKKLRDLRQYCSHIRNQVMQHHRALRKTEITYIDLDRLDDISITIHQNIEALKKRGVSRAVLKQFMHRGDGA
jgi:predicted RNase H-like nuclease (RuvC/YqgF family)